MNHTDKAKYELAKKMLTGKIDIEEVSMMTGLSVEQLQPLKEELEENVRKVYGDVKIYDFEKGDVVFDTFNDTGEDMDIPKEEDKK